MGDFMDEVLNNLTKIIKQNDNFIIMTHKNPDFDGMGSAIALQQIIKSFKKESYIVVNEKEIDKSLKRAFSLLKDKNIYCNTISIKKAENLLDDSHVLIILDTCKSERLESKNFIKKTKNIVIIDHHIISQDYIKESIFNYINSNLSSITEFMCNYLKYLNKKVDSIIATFLLVGLEIDTNNFKLKTTDKTYETAAYLTRLGADNVLKQELLKESMEEYIKRSKLIEKSFMINKNMAMCIADNKIYRNQDLASIAEELLQFENVEASFVIGKINSNIVGVSARSIGTINVEQIMSKLGGGGHINEAATQIPNKTISETEQLVKEAIQ
jgi:c-di-AMP phosphodiesterase-like protein